MQHKNYRFLFILLSSLSLFTACQKVHDAPETPPGTQPPTTTVASADDILKDSVLLNTREIYLWYNQIPASFNPRIFGNPDSIMRGITPRGINQFSREPGFPNPVDRFSFASRKVEWDMVVSGIAGDFGIGIFFLSPDDLRVKSVERESPAGKAGVRRGWRITKISGNNNITTSNIPFIVDKIFSSNSTTFTFAKPDGGSVDITLNVASYKKHPVMVDSVYTVGSKKIGYLVFASFLGDQVEINSELDRVFNRFTNAGVSDVVVDLRYNGGGFVSVAERLSNYLAPSSANGSLMMKQEYNDKYSKFNTSVNFKKIGSLNLSRIIFIVSSSSASASELLINNLLPVMDVKLIGRNKTFGKPVGFFSIPVGEWYIFPVSFKTVNSQGKSDYYEGFTPNAIVPDGLANDFGDVNEASLASAIKFITTGAYRLQSGQSYQELPQVSNGNLLLDEPTFKGTIDGKRSLK